jgi:hypothetical protein
MDDDKRLVLIHFEGWNQRYDEWVEMDSNRLRPLTRHSDRKGKGGKRGTSVSKGLLHAIDSVECSGFKIFF